MDKNKMNYFVTRNKETILVYFIMIVVFILFAFNQADFFTRFGLQSIFNQVITLSVAALAQTMIILTSGIDLSIGAIMGLTNSIAATIMAPVIAAVGVEWLGIAITCFIVLLVGTLAGLLNGIFVVYGRLQPIIVTLATASVFTGIALYIRPTPGGEVSLAYTSFLTGRVLTYIPVSAIILAIFVFAVWIPLRRSRLGQSIYAMGGNEYSAYVSGINVDRTKLWVYILAGFFTACAGLLLTAQTASGDPLGTELFTLNSIAAVVLGGTSLFGGRGGYIGSVAGAVVLSLILGLLIFWGVPSFYQNAVQGIILILALASGVLQQFFKKKKSRKTQPVST
jgi:ribose transport system permease protein